MKCTAHPSVECVKGIKECFLCGEVTAGSFGIQTDLRAAEYERMSQHVQPGIRGINTTKKYQRLLKRNGLTDDIGMKELRACVIDKAKRERARDAKIKSYLDHMTPKLQEKAARLKRREQRRA